MPTEKEVTSLLVRLLSGSQRPLKGSELSVLVRTSLPEFDPLKFGCRNLRDFVRSYASNEIREVDKAGMDIIYGLRSEEQPPLFQAPPSQIATQSSTNPDNRGLVGQLLENPRIWKTFASPETPFRLFLVPASRQIRVVRPNQAADPNWIEIPRIAAEKLQQIARDFISALPEAQQGVLSPTLTQTRWWFPFFELVRTLGLKFRYIAYRRSRLIDEFERSLPTLPSVPQPPEEAILSQPIPETPAGTETESAMKRIAAQVVQRMTDSELRSLNLPLGYVVDVMTTR